MKNNAIEIFRQHGGQLKMSEAISLGISRYMLYSLYEKGVLEKVSPGIYRLDELPPISNPDLVTVSLRFPKAVICLVSALAFHEITTQIPHAVSVAVPKNSRTIHLESPPVTTHKFSQETYAAGIDKHEMDGVNIRVYNVEKTLADCFKFRNRIGMDIVLEALKLYSNRKKIRINDLLNYARICRVEAIIKPYLEILQE